MTSVPGNVLPTDTIPQPLVSVVIPAYNAAAFIAETLDSVVAQTYRPIEIIVVDDGSTDETSTVVRQYTTSIADITLSYLYQENSGPSKARNTGIRAAKGEYIAFLDADDLWSYGKLERQIDLFNQDDSIDIVFANAEISRYRAGIRRKEIQIKAGDDEILPIHESIVANPLEAMIRNNFMPTSSVVVKRSCFVDEVFFNENRRYVEDWELWLKMALRCKFAYVNDVCVHKKEEGAGLSSYSARMTQSAIDVLEDFLGRYAEEVLMLVDKRKLSGYLKDFYKWKGYALLLNGNPVGARELLKKSLQEGYDMKTALYYLKTFFDHPGGTPNTENRIE